jgi:PAS domain S-box-containing protein
MELHQAELKYRIVADFNYDWEYWKHLDGTLRYVSPSCERISGYQPEAFIKRPDLLREIIVPEDRDLWDGHDCDSLKKPGTRECQFRVKRPDGEIRWIEHICQPVTEAAGKYIGIRASNRDITLRKDSERQEQQHRDELANVMRVATLGELTSSLAHEFNQPLNAVLNNAQAGLRFLHRETPDLGEVEAALQDIARDGKRASAVIQRLRSFLKPGLMHPEAMNLNGVIQEAVALVQNELLSRHIATRFSLAPDLPPVRGDRIQVQQVVLNLLLNAMEAMKKAGTDSHEIHLKTVQESPDLITASLQDTGKGLPSEALERIFEPFWTSKSAGLGLGLSISQSIISAHGGRLWARANADRGAAFFFTLPCYQGDSHEPHAGHSLRRGWRPLGPGRFVKIASIRGIDGQNFYVGPGVFGPGSCRGTRMCDCGFAHARHERPGIARAVNDSQPEPAGHLSDGLRHGACQRPGHEARRGGFSGKAGG